MRDDMTADRVARLCHDLRQNVAAGLLLAAERPGDDTLPEDVRLRLRLVVEQLRAVSDTITAEGGRQMRVVDLAELAAECARTAEAAHAMRVELVVEPCPKLLIEPSSVRRAINNLLDNASRATRSGVVEMRVLNHRGYVAVEVLDDGLGFGTIPGCTGWGLAQVRAAMDAHGGLFERPDSPTGGTLIRLSLPVHREPRRSAA